MKNLFLTLLITCVSVTYADHHNMFVKFMGGPKRFSVVKSNASEKDGKEYKAWQQYVKNSMAFACGSNCNYVEEVSIDGALNSHELTIHTRVNKLTSPGHDALATAFFGRFQYGGHGIITKNNLESPNLRYDAAYFYNTPLYINGSRVKGDISILIAELERGIATSKSQFRAIFNNNPNGKYLETEDGNCYKWDARVSEYQEKATINISNYSCPKNS